MDTLHVSVHTLVISSAHEHMKICPSWGMKSTAMNNLHVRPLDWKIALLDSVLDLLPDASTSDL